MEFWRGVLLGSQEVDEVVFSFLTITFFLATSAYLIQESLTEDSHLRTTSTVGNLTKWTLGFSRANFGIFRAVKHSKGRICRAKRSPATTTAPPLQWAVLLLHKYPLDATDRRTTLH